MSARAPKHRSPVGSSPAPGVVPAGTAPVRGGLDRRGRPLGNLRLSVTDRCNLRCSYCMPEENYTWLPRNDLLSFEEIALLVDVFCELGVDKVRLTGGEPLLRRGLDELIGTLATKPGIRDLALTTNAILLADQAERLKAAGLDRVTISLDTLVPERFERLTRRDELARVLAGIEATRAAGFENTKLNTVVQRGFNDDEIVPIIEYAREHGLEPRFIEYMDVGGATRWSLDDVLSRVEILERIARELGPVEPVDAEDRGRVAPAGSYRLADGTSFGVIASTTVPFCANCDRSRLTSDGLWYTCLYAPTGTDLRGPLRSGASRRELQKRILGRWTERADRGAEERLRAGVTRAAPAKSVDPHLEMHTRGG